MLKQVFFHAIFFIIVIKYTMAADNTGIDISSFPDNIKKDFFDIANQIVPTDPLQPQNVTADNIQYYLVTKENPDTYEEISTSGLHRFDSTSLLVFFIHGWTQNRSNLWYELLKEAFFERAGQYDIVQVDYSTYAKLDYVNAASCVKPVGGFIGEFIVKLINDRGVNIKNFIIIGHSLGGQVVAFVGKKVIELLKTKLPKIIALDPTGVLFETRPESERLNPNDAKVVHVIHTDEGVFGFLGSCGTIDFFPNGGSSQNGCLKTVLTNVQNMSSAVVCNHFRSWRYFIEGLTLSEKFISKRCLSYVDYKTTQTTCSQETASLGVLNLTSSGNFYLDTNSESPYSK